MTKIFLYNLMIISFLLSSCSTEVTTTTAAAITYPTSFSGDTASGSMTVGSDSFSGTYMSMCAPTAGVGGPTDSTHVGFIIIVKSAKTFTKEINYYTDSACTTLSLGWYSSYDTPVIGDASGTAYQFSYNLVGYDFFAASTTSETYIEEAFGNIFDVTVGTKYNFPIAASYKNLIEISGTSVYFGTESASAYPTSTDTTIAFVQQ